MEEWEGYLKKEQISATNLIKYSDDLAVRSANEPMERARRLREEREDREAQEAKDEETGRIVGGIIGNMLLQYAK